MSPRSRAVIALSVSTVAALALAALLVFGALDRLRVRAAEANIDFVLTQLRTAIESSVSLGLALPDIPVGQDLIERARAGNTEILAIEVFGPDGISIFNTDRGSLGEPITSSWQDAQRRSPGRWRVEDVGVIVVGDIIRNDFGEPVGGIAVTVSGEARAANAQSLVATLVPWTGLVAGIATLLVGGAAVVLLGYAGRDFRQAAGALTGPQSASSAGAVTGGDLVGLAATMRAHVRERAAEILAAAETVRALDDEEDGRPSAPDGGNDHRHPVRQGHRDAA